MIRDLLKEEIGKRYKLYLALYESQISSPSTFTDHFKTVIINSIMGGHSYGWRVIGITQEALNIYNFNEFKHKSGMGITRAHITPRIEITRMIFPKTGPLKLDNLTEIYVEHDRTILCARGQNTTCVGPYKKIENDGAQLFAGKSVGWRHGNGEQELLRKLWAGCDKELI